MMTIKAKWSAYSVRKTCINNDFCTSMTCDEYERMLDWVSSHEPTAYNVETAAREIAELQAAIEELTQYRADMAARAAYLVTAVPTITASLTRRRNYWTNRVYYDFVELAAFPDGTTQEITKATYPGTDRAKALAFVRQYQRDTGRTVDVNIKRPDWER